MEIDLKKISLLVVDDSSINQRVVSMSLRSRIDHIDTASNGLETFQKYCKKRYDVILMDGRMPVMDGYEATRKIREYEKENKVEKPSLIIALTGSDTDKDINISIQAGINACMLKPFRIHEFLKILNDLNAVGDHQGED